jgi:hypothetical protein
LRRSGARGLCLSRRNGADVLIGLLRCDGLHIDLLLGRELDGFINPGLLEDDVAGGGSHRERRPDPEDHLDDAFALF